MEHDETSENPVFAKWREIATELAKIERRMESYRAKYDDLSKREAMLRGALRESGIDLPDQEKVPVPKRRVTSRQRGEDLVLRVTAPGEVVRAEDVLQRFKDAGIEVEWTNAGAAVRNAMRRSEQFVSVGRGKFKRGEGERLEEDSDDEAPPPRGNGASFDYHPEA